MTKENTKQTITGELTFEDRVLQKIIGLSLEHVDGLLSVDGGFFSNLADKITNSDNVTSGISVEVGKKQVAIDLAVIVEYKKNINKIYAEMKELVQKEVLNMTELEVVEFNVNVVDIKTKEQFASDSKKKEEEEKGKGTTKSKDGTRVE